VKREEGAREGKGEQGTHLCELVLYCSGSRVSNHSPGIGRRRTRARQGHKVGCVEHCCVLSLRRVISGNGPDSGMQSKGHNRVGDRDKSRVHVIVRGSSVREAEDGSYVERWVWIFWYQFACICSYIFVCP
jgi:hypothetical protein